MVGSADCAHESIDGKPLAALECPLGPSHAVDRVGEDVSDSRCKSLGGPLREEQSWTISSIVQCRGNPDIRRDDGQVRTGGLNENE